MIASLPPSPSHLTPNRRVFVLLRRLWAALFLSLSAMAPAFSGYTIQVGKFASVENLEQACAALQEKNIGPLVVTEVDTVSGKRSVLSIGGFRKFVDAHLARVKLEEILESQLLVKPAGYLIPDAPTDPLSLIPPFFENAPENAAQLPVQSLKGNAAYDILHTAANEKSIYTEVLLVELPKTTDSDPLRGYILASLGALEIQNKNYDKAYEYLEPVAHGKVSSAAEDRVMAMRRVAWLIHWKKDRLNAYHAYRHLERFTHMEEVYFICKVACAGLLMELAESGKGTHEEVRLDVEAALSEIPLTETRLRITLELIRQESFARQKNPDFQTAALIGEAIVGSYSAALDPPVLELAVASYQTAMYYRMTGNVDKAKEWAHNTLSNYPNAASFHGIFPHAQAKIGLAEIYYAETQDAQGYRSRIAEIIASYPDDHAAIKLRKLYPTLVRSTNPGE